ncbi:MAG: DUF4367 domain-containing protein [Oscillospiraceae bacterium]
MHKITLSSDTLLRFAFAEAEHREMDARHALIEETGGYQPSPEFQRRIELLVQAEKRSYRYRQIQKVVKRVAVYVVVLIALSSCVLFSAEAVQKVVISTMIEWHDKFALFTYSNDSNAAAALPETISVGYWPEGYTEKSSESKRIWNTYLVAYSNNAGDFSSVYVRAISGEETSAIDNENSEIFQIIVDDKTMLCSTHSDGTIMLRWTEGHLLFEVATPENLQEAIAIARSINYK